MCGIAGIFNLNGAAVDRERLRRMTELLHHRGPDDTAFYEDGSLGFGHARLSIIDPATGQQPMSNPDRSLWITFNGEIFNYLELRKQLENKGYRFSTQSDTEVLLRLYEDQGPSCVHDLNGQWAFAIWDRPRRRLFLSRDRLGIRPLVYTHTSDRFLFASEIKSLFVDPSVSRAIDPRALDQIFTFWAPLAGRTVFKEIQEVPAGHSLIVSKEGMRLERYWQLDFSCQEDRHALERAPEELLELLIDAVRLRLRADVPVGAYLSGGLDSSLVTALIRRFTHNPLKTFSVVFDDPEFDESDFQQRVVGRLETEHHSIHCHSGEIGNAFPHVIRHAEKPILRTAPAPLLRLSELVHRHNYKVVLTGEGSDELFGGYDIYKEAKIRRFWGGQPNSRFRPLLLKRLYPYLNNLQAQSPAYLQAFFRVGPNDLRSPFFSHLPRWNLASGLKLFFSDALKEELKHYDCVEELRSSLPPAYSDWDYFARAQYLEAAVLLPGYILSSQGDRVAMAHSVEGRFPFLDHRVVALASRLPIRLKMRGLNEKYLLKQVARELVPEEVLARPKQPYRAPEGISFFDCERGRPRFEYVRDMLSEPRLKEAGLFNPAAVSRLLEKASQGKAVGIRDNMAVVGILSSQMVYHQFIQEFGR